MKSFVVMQGDTYPLEKEEGVIWSPQIDHGGGTPPSWLRLTEVRQGDRIFHYVRGDIVAVSIATRSCEAITKSFTEEEEENERLKEDRYEIKLKYHELEIPIHVHKEFEAIVHMLPVKYSPFKPNGNGNSGYLYPCNEKLAITLLELISDKNIYQVDEEQLELAIDTVRRPVHNTFFSLITETEAEMKVKIRTGEQKFRRGLVPLWEHKCALCEIELTELLQAIRSKPWKDSTDFEKVDPYNGVLLCSNHGVLYHKGFIAFDGQGRLHISPELKEENYEKYGLRLNMKVPRKLENKPYFKWHKRKVFKK